MKRFLYFPCALCLVIGLLVGVLLPINFQEDGVPSGNSPGAPQSDSGSSADSPAQTSPLAPEENFPLLSSACAVNGCLKRQDWSALAAYVHPDWGVSFTPYSTVEPDSDLNFTAAQIKGMALDQTVYTWGFEDGRGDPIKMTAEQYFDRYVYDKDYAQAPEIGVDRVITGGNALENLAEAYAGCRFVDFSFPSADPGGMDWTSLKLVFRAGDEHWYLVGIVHGEWTI